MDYINYFSDDWFSHVKIKIMEKNLNIFFNKKILVYGLGKSGLSTYNFLKKNNDVLLYDDFQKKQKNLKSYKFILKKKFDYIIISPGIDIDKCK